MESIGNRVKTKRNALGMSQEDLAKEAGVTQGTIDKIENDRSKKSKFLPEVFAALALIAAIFGACWLHFNRQNELQAMRKQLDIEYFFQAKGFSILQIPVAGTAIFPTQKP